MTGTDLLKSIGDIDDDLIHEAYIQYSRFPHQPNGPLRNLG